MFAEKRAKLEKKEDGKLSQQLCDNTEQMEGKIHFHGWLFKCLLRCVFKRAVFTLSSVMILPKMQ